MKVGLWAEIRRLTEIEKLSQRAIVRRLHCCDKTVRKALAMDEPPTQAPAKVRKSILDPYRSQIDALIEKYPVERIHQGPVGEHNDLRALPEEGHLGWLHGSEGRNRDRWTPSLAPVRRA